MSRFYRSITSLIPHRFTEFHRVQKRSIFQFVSKQTIVPLTAPKKSLIPLSMLDRLMVPVYSPTFFIYSNIPRDGFPGFLKKLQKSLAEVLVPYYPLAGRLKMNQNTNSWDIYCEDHDQTGVELSVVTVDEELSKSKYCKPCLELRQLVPELDGRVRDGFATPVMSVQVTRFKCGAVALGCGFHHQALDAKAISMFMLAWSELAQGKKLSFIPTHNRSASYDLSFLTTSTSRRPPAASVKNSGTSTETKVIESNSSASSLQALVFGGDDVRKLKSMAPPGSTSFQVTTAFLVRHIMKASPTPHDGISRFMFMTDFRRQFSASKFAGNLALPMLVTEPLEKVVSKPLKNLVETIQKATSSANTTYFKTFLQQASGMVKDTSTFPLLAVSSCTRLPLYEVDFGYGAACLAGFSPPDPAVAPQSALTLPSSANKSDLVVYLQLPKDVLSEVLRDPEFMSFVKLFKPVGCQPKIFT